MKLMDIDSDTLGIPDTEYDARVTLASSEFSRIVRDLSQLGESVRIEVSKEGVRFASEGEAANGSVLLRQAEGTTISGGKITVEKDGGEEVKEEKEGEEDGEEAEASTSQKRDKKEAKKVKVKEKKGDEDVEMKDDEDDDDKKEDDADSEPKSDGEDGEEEKVDEEPEEDEDDDGSSKKRKKKVTLFLSEARFWMLILLSQGERRWETK